MFDIYNVAAGAGRFKVPGPIHALRFLSGARSARLSTSDVPAAAARVMGSAAAYSFKRPLASLYLWPSATEALIFEVARDENLVLAPASMDQLPVNAAGGLVSTIVDANGLPYSAANPLSVETIGSVDVRDGGNSLTVDAPSNAPLFVVPPGLELITSGVDVDTTQNTKEITSSIDVSAYADLVYVWRVNSLTGTAFTFLLAGLAYYDSAGAMVMAQLTMAGAAITTIAAGTPYYLICPAGRSAAGSAAVGGGAVAYSVAPGRPILSTHVRLVRYVAGATFTANDSKFYLYGRKG